MISFRYGLWCMLFAFLGCNRPGNEGLLVDLRTVSVLLGSPIHDSPDLPFANRRGLSGFIYLDAPAEVSLHFPSGGSWKKRSELTMVDEVEGMISKVTVTPLKDSLPFNKVLNFLESDANDLGINRSDLFVGFMARLTSSPPSWDPFSSQSFRFSIDHDVSVFVEIRPSSEYGKWYLSYDFAVKKAYSLD